MNYGKRHVEEAIKKLAFILGLSYPNSLQDEYGRGLHPNLLASSSSDRTAKLPALQKYIIIATSYLNQPAHYYEIFAACRCVSLIQPLAHAVENLSKNNVKAHEARFQKLLTTIDQDDFEAVLFEIIVASRYLSSPDVTHVEFIPETSSKRTPDISFTFRDTVESYCECKKIKSISDYSLSLDKQVNEILMPLIDNLKENNIPLSGEIYFLDDPKNISFQRLLSLFKSAICYGSAIIEKDIILKAEILRPYQFDTYKLFPSPEFLWERYQYRKRGEWLGIVHQAEANYCSLPILDHLTGLGQSSWIDCVTWDAAIKWRIDRDSMLPKKRRIPFNTVFSGLDQIREKNIGSTLHVWIDSEYAIGNRQAVMKDLFHRLKKNGKDSFGWIILNESYFDVSPKGMFDLIEHAHPIAGPVKYSNKPIVSGVFMDEFPYQGPPESFGIGTQLPDIDETL